MKGGRRLSPSGVLTLLSSLLPAFFCRIEVFITLLLAKEEAGGKKKRSSLFPFVFMPHDIFLLRPVELNRAPVSSSVASAYYFYRRRKGHLASKAFFLRFSLGMEATTTLARESGKGEEGTLVSPLALGSQDSFVHLYRFAFLAFPILLFGVQCMLYFSEVKRRGSWNDDGCCSLAFK